MLVTERGDGHLVTFLTNVVKHGRILEELIQHGIPKTKQRVDGDEKGVFAVTEAESRDLLGNHGRL